MKTFIASEWTNDELKSRLKLSNESPAATSLSVGNWSESDAQMIDYAVDLIMGDTKRNTFKSTQPAARNAISNPSPLAYARSAVH